MLNAEYFWFSLQHGLQPIRSAGPRKLLNELEKHGPKLDLQIHQRYLSFHHRYPCFFLRGFLCDQLARPTLQMGTQPSRRNCHSYLRSIWKRHQLHCFQHLLQIAKSNSSGVLLFLFSKNYIQGCVKQIQSGNGFYFALNT